MRTLLLFILGITSWITFSGLSPADPNAKPTLCILGGTPSTKDIVHLIPDSIRSRYNVISFNRPGFGGSENGMLSIEKLVELAKAAGLKKSDYGIIGVSGGGPMAVLLADKLKLKHCGVISGMVSKEAFFKYGDKAVTKGIMESALGDYKDFERAALRFPNIDEIVKQAGASSKEIALRACYDEFNFILTDKLFPTDKKNLLSVDWWHGEHDANVPIQSAELFLSNFPNARLKRIPDASHAIDANVYISKLLSEWK